MLFRSPRMAAEAKEEGFTQLAALFTMVAQIEKEHEERYRELAENLKNNKVFAREEQQVWQCRNCGYTYIGKSAPLKCPDKTVEEVVDICMQDIDFYEESNGGVTLSGGEAMVQYDFMMALVHALKEKGLHLAIETTGIVDHEKFKKAAPLFDLLLFDVKQADPMKHKKGTHVTNEVIQKNFKWAIEQGLNEIGRASCRERV